ncbi:protein TIFY 6B isoform X2 [Hevea brasiliensis]|uniref:protein TIFY 6B isoform X2 n=1 Tax=Hevea brasiliensis TaxID=3981 RepID=UPI0025FF4A6A|nr:protein TIFY 6B isoform X2 [Hevea brasiliensis]
MGWNGNGVPMRGSAMQWSFSNKVSAIPQFLSFQSGVEEKPRKTIHDHISSSGFTPISTANQKPCSSMIQKNMTLDKQGANHYAMTTYTVKHFDAYPVHCPQQIRIFPVSDVQNQRITASMSSPVLQSHFSSTGHNVGGHSMNSQFLAGVPIISPVSVHSTPSSIVGTADLRNGSKSSGAPAQLTIFYAGSVFIYDDISPEKAQAIMLLAGNGSSVTQNKTVSPAQVQAPIRRPSAGDDLVGNKIHSASPCSGLPSPISISSSSNNELATVKSMRDLASRNNQTEPPKAVSSVGTGSATLIPAVAVPQARKASLARFLEKRKERMMNTSPYNVSKKSPDSSSAEYDGVSLAIN